MNLAPLILPVVLAAGLSSIYVLPQTGEVAASAISMNLPDTLGDWQLTKSTTSRAELEILSSDTAFSKAVCFRPKPDEFFSTNDSTPDRIDLSVVLSGYDLNNSIHRPERCLPAQGHTILSSSVLPLTLTNGRRITVRRLKTTQSIVNPATRKIERSFDSITYYFFVGHDRVEEDHVQRTLIDMKDRLLHGIDQRWAYVTASIWFGKLPWLAEPISEREADAKLTEFLTAFAERQIDWKQVK